MGQIILTIESDIENLALVSVAVHRICEYLGAGGEVTDQMELCVNEAVANCIHHAYRNAPGHLISVRIGASGDEIQCDVCDTGTPMPAAHAETLAMRPSEHKSFDEKNLQMEEHGRGLKIIASLMDEAAYLSDGRENCLRMKKRIQA